MKKLIVLFIAAFLTVSVIGQNQKSHISFLKSVNKQKEISIPGIDKSFPNFHSQNKPDKQMPILKEANGLKQRLDSVVAPEIDKDVYFYDANGNMILDIYSEWEDMQWRNTAKYVNSFDASGNLVKNIIVNWENGQWVNYMKDEYTFDVNGNRTQNMSFLWTNNEWVNIYQKDEYTYDASGNQTQHLSYDWDNDQYMKSGKEESAFDKNGNEIQNIRYFWDGNQWINWLKNEFTFDESGNNTQSIEFNWENDLWVNSLKSEISFDSNGKNTHSIDYRWDGENWFNIEKYETFYDVDENISQFVYFEWNSLEWVEAAKFEYQYDGNGNQILSKLTYLLEDQQIVFLKEESVYDDYGNRISYSFLQIDGENEEFILLPAWKQEHVYDNSFSFEDLILPFTSSDFEDDSENDFEGEVGEFDINMMFKHKLVRITNYEGDGDSWLKYGDYIVYYSEQNITGVEDLSLAKIINIYPNPATNQITFSVDASVNQFTLEFYDNQGKLVYQQLAYNNNPVSIESLNKGLYFYRLTENQNSYSGKFMVK